jgi:hypothetical protein
MDYKSLHSQQVKLGNFLNRSSGSDVEEATKFKLIEIDHPNGWSFSEIDQLGDMGFKIDNDTDMVSEIEVPTMEMAEEKVPIRVYKTDDGYVLETHRHYVFESFEKMIDFIDSVPSDPKMKGLK